MKLKTQITDVFALFSPADLVAEQSLSTKMTLTDALLAGYRFNGLKMEKRKMLKRGFVMFT